jgi:hypothetical protein
MLDLKGISLEEVQNKYNVSMQTLGFDTPLDVDSGNKPLVISTFELVVNSIITLLMMKPGQFPSIPELGLDIESYLFEYSDDPNVILRLKAGLEDQCNRLGWSGITTDIFVDEVENGIPVIVVTVDGVIYYSTEAKRQHAVVGISYDKLKRVYIRKRMM